MLFYPENQTSIWTEYMIKSNQTLSSIAYEVYGNHDEWKNK